MRAPLGLIMMVLGCAACFASEVEIGALYDRLRALEDQSCVPNLKRTPEWTFTGWNRDVARNSTTSREFYAKGTVSLYNLTSRGHLFDLNLGTGGRAYNFVCGLGADSPLRAHCALTFEDPWTPEGPAWIEMRFQATRDATGDCVATSATIVGTYFYDALTSNAGMPAPGVRKGGLEGRKGHPFSGLLGTSSMRRPTGPGPTRSGPRSRDSRFLPATPGGGGAPGGWTRPSTTATSRASPATRTAASRSSRCPSII